MYNNDSLKKRIKEVRISADKSQIEVAKLMNVSRSSYAMWESCNNMFPLKRLIDFCNILNVSIDYLFGLSEVKSYDVITIYDKNKFRERLKKLRKDNKLTQLKLANILNTVHPVITNYEKGKHLISTSFLYEICYKYRISADYLIGSIDDNSIK